jgi:hypothetical protein
MPELIVSTAEDVAERIFAAGLGAIELLSVHIGDRLGLYRAVVELGEPTVAEVAARSGVHERYAREWLEQQAVIGLLTARGGDVARRFAMPDATREVLLDPTSLNYLGPLARMVAASAAKLPDLLTAYRTGAGVSWGDLGPDARESQADMNRPWFEQRLAGALAGVHQVDVSGTDVGEGYDAVFAFECVHDLSAPVEFLATARRATAADGVTVVMDEAVQPEFTAPGDDLERLMYGFSLLVCLPDGMSSQPSAATGTVMREGTLRGYAQAAGFADVEVLPVEDFGFFRFYRLH